MEKSSVNRVYNIKVYKFGLVNSCVHTIANPETRKKTLILVLVAIYFCDLFLPERGPWVISPTNTWILFLYCLVSLKNSQFNWKRFLRQCAAQYEALCCTILFSISRNFCPIRLGNEVIEFFGLVVRMMYYPEEILVLENQSFYLFVRKRNC